MRQYQRELEADEHTLEEDSSNVDESEDHVPLHWRNYDFSRCTVNTGRWDCAMGVHGEWGLCRRYVPQYCTSEGCGEEWSTLTLHREFSVVKSCIRIYDVCCIKDDCSFECMHIWGSGTITYRWKKWKVTCVPLIVLIQGTKTFQPILLQATCTLT
jgi:hypothetical protein